MNLRGVLCAAALQEHSLTQLILDVLENDTRLRLVSTWERLLHSLDDLPHYLPILHGQIARQ